MNASEKLIIINRTGSASVNGWIHIVPKGELPNRAAGIVQVLDDCALDSILANIEADRDRLGNNWPGIYAGREHFIYNDDQDSSALAWFKDFEKRADGIWAKDDGLTPDGQLAIQNKRYKYTSFVADRADAQKLDDTRYRILKIDTVGFTNQANGKDLLVPITNRDSVNCPECGTAMKVGMEEKKYTCPNCGKNFADASASAASQTKTKNRTNTMKSIAQKLGLAAEASEDAILAEVTKIINRGDISVADLATLRKEHGDFKTLNETLLTEQIDSLLDAHGIKADDKVRNRLKPALTSLKNREERLAALADFGFKPVEAKKETAGGNRVLNRGEGVAKNRQQEEVTADDGGKAAADKIKNRANELKGQNPNRKFEDCWNQAQSESATN